MHLTGICIYHKLETFEDPRGGIAGKKFISGRDERKLENEKALKQNFTSQPEIHLFIASRRRRHSEHETEVCDIHRGRTLLSVSPLFVQSNGGCKLHKFTLSRKR